MQNSTRSNLFEPDAILSDSLTEMLRKGARELIAEAVETELKIMLNKHAQNRLPDGRLAVVRNGYLPERTIQTGIGDVEIKVPKVRDRSGSGIKFNSSLLPPYLKRAESIEELLPWLYLKGISTGDFQEALVSLLGKDAQGLSARTISRLKSDWIEEHRNWSRRDLSKKRYVYWWADGIYSNVRSDDKLCLLVVIGVTETGVKELVAVEDGLRESADNWYGLLSSLRSRGLKTGPRLAVGDGALGFWNALARVFPVTRRQRCWVHKTANILNRLPKSLHPKAKAALQEIWMAETKEDAEKAFDSFLDRFGDKYPKATECLRKDREDLLAFYDFPAVHWVHIRTTNPIESTFSTVRLRTRKTRNCGSRETTLAMVFKLMQSAEKRWKRIKGFDLIGEVIEGVVFKDGLRATNQPDKDAA